MDVEAAVTKTHSANTSGRGFLLAGTVIALVSL
jgi:hypothetical protein